MIAENNRNDTDELLAELAEENPKAMTADGFQDALIGITANYHHPVVAVYDLGLCVEVLMDQGMTEDDALEYLQFNTISAYVGPNGPLFIKTL